MRYTIENEFLKAEISNLGATLTRLIDKKSGIDVVLGFDTDEDYIRNSGNNIGATIGRNSNRIGNAEFVLNGKKYKLSVNDNMNQLHGGGDNGFAFKTWKLESLNADTLVLSYLSKDLEEGFPGNLKVTVTYRLEADTITEIFSGLSDQDTIFNMTNHSYFNLGDENILDHYLHMTADVYSPTDRYGLTLDETRKTEGTPYDFSSFSRIKDHFKDIINIDNNYVWENMDDKLMCELKNDKLQLNIYSDLPDMHVYTAYYLSTDTSKTSKAYGKYDGIALEAQFYPNGINYGDHYLSPVIRKGEEVSHYIRYQIKNL